MYWYRCSKKICRQRRSLRKPKEEYKREKKCPCGGKLTPVPYDKIRAKKQTCTCDGWWFPHQKGCKWCNHYEGEYTQEDLMERQQAMRN